MILGWPNIGLVDIIDVKNDLKDLIVVAWALRILIRWSWYLVNFSCSCNIILFL